MTFPPESRRHPESQPLEVAEELLQLLAGSCEIRRAASEVTEDAEAASEQHERARDSGPE